MPQWLEEVMRRREVDLWGVADLTGTERPVDESGEAFPRALAFALPVHPLVMAGVMEGPTAGYAMEYRRLNGTIDAVASELTGVLRERGCRAVAPDASRRTDEANLCGDFPHKTAATRAGLGWIGRHCQLITRPFGSWVRLGTVLTDAELPCGPPLERSYCGTCTACVRACPAGALSGKAWRPGVLREEILDARACDEWKKQRYGHLMQGRVCGICSAVCPFSRTRGRRAAKRTDPAPPWTRF
jgi:epoxyqueuosine reductase QueG